MMPPPLIHLVKEACQARGPSNRKKRKKVHAFPRPKWS